MKNPEEEPEVWLAPPAPDNEGEGGDDEGDFLTGPTSASVQTIATSTPDDTSTEDVSRVNPAPGYNEVDSFGSTFDSSSEEQMSGGSSQGAAVSPALSTESDTSLLTKSDTSLGDDSTPPCRSSDDPQSFSSYGSRSSKNPGIVLRYQYELIQDLTGVDWTINSQGERDGTDYLVESVVPAIERGIVGALAPALFEECGVRRKLRRLYVGGNVVGVDMSPEDFPLPQIGMLCPLLLSYLSFTKTPF